jgi:hypothetical protein
VFIFENYALLVGVRLMEDKHEFTILQILFKLAEVLLEVQSFNKLSNENYCRQYLE